MMWRRGRADLLAELTAMSARYLEAQDETVRLQSLAVARAKEHADAMAEAHRMMAVGRAACTNNNWTLGMLVEPPRVEGCVKLQFRNRKEANDFARRLEADNGSEEGVLDTYPCRVCPLNFITQQRHWHVFHVDYRERGLHGAQYNRTRPREMGRMPLDVLAEIRRGLGGAA